ncbi:bifunctional DNA primase/polymerase, partial [Frankia sp. EI5c]|uniref:bifunctional DNA primase/polymerase n=1 Tax=Frankia sp. EI5c TaxID=683316 RepID=UPI0037BE5822
MERTGNGIFPLHSYEDNRCTCSDLSCSSPGKHPRTASGFKEATADRVQIRAWVRQWPGCNWGGVTAGLVVVDLDGSRGADGWAALVDEHGETPTLTHRTGRGRHLIYRQNGTKVSNSASKIADSVDIRADGGYIVLPGSLHPSGRLYETEQ